MLASRPRLVHALRLPGGEPAMVRPVGPRDAGALQAYVRALSPEARYSRFFGPLFELSPVELDRVTHLDRRSQLAVIVEACIDGGSTVVGEARYALSPDGDFEFALSIADAFRRKGLGALLMADLEAQASRLGAHRLVADVLRSNLAMQSLARKSGFALTDVPREARAIRIVKDLRLSRTAPREAATVPTLPIAA